MHKDRNGKIKESLREIAIDEADGKQKGGRDGGRDVALGFWSAVPADATASQPLPNLARRARIESRHK